jgi:hypothetical protein
VLGAEPGPLVRNPLVTFDESTDAATPILHTVIVLFD